MDEMKKERQEGFDWDYIGEAFQEKQEVGDTYITPLASHLGQLFAMTAKIVIDRLGPEEGEAVLKEIVERFAEVRGKRVAEKVKALGKPLTLKNFLVYNDLDSAGVISDSMPGMEDGDLLFEIGQCNICKGAEEWGLREYAHYYCKYIDKAIIKAYNPEIKLEVSRTLTGGDEACSFRYTVKEGK